MRIPLPIVKKGPGALAHPFPFQICFQTQEFLQSTLFHVCFMDCAVGEMVRLPEGMDRIEALLVDNFYSKESYKQCWEYLVKYQAIFEKSVFSNVLISLCSNWDWYLRQLSRFVQFGREYVESPELNKDEKSQFSRIGNLPILKQLVLLDKATGVETNLHPEMRAQLQEMTLVRNLGLHNRWEVDEKYLEYSATGSLTVGDLRLIELKELHIWHVYEACN